MTEQLGIDFTTPAPLNPPQAERGGEGELTHEEMYILRLLQRGKENAVSVKYLAAAIGLSEVELRAKIKHIVEEHGILIVSSTGKNHGYFYPKNNIEYKAGVNQLVHRIRSLAKRIRAMDKEAYEQIFGQRNIFEDNNAA